MAAESSSVPAPFSAAGRRLVNAVMPGAEIDALDLLVSLVRDRIAATPPRPPRLLDVAEVAEALSISRRQVWRLISAGELRSVLIGDRRLVTEGALREFIDGLEGRR